MVDGDSCGPYGKKAFIKCNECDTKSMFHPLAFHSTVLFSLEDKIQMR